MKLCYALGFVGIVALAGNATAQGTLFPVSYTYPAVDAPTGLELADLDGDGDLDCVVANYFSDKLSIYLGNGDGTFQVRPPIAVGGSPRALALGDLNGDGAPDVVTANSTGGSVSVLLGNGSGGFGAPTVYSVGSLPVAIDIGDLDGDGDLDVVVGDQSTDALYVLLGNGAGGLSTAMQQPLGFSPERIALADLDLDGDLDCVSACWLDDRVRISRGDGLGNLIAGPHVFVPSPKGLTLGDVSGDGRPDVVAASSQYDTVYVFQTQANATLAPAKTHWLGASVDYPTEAVLADASGDGRLDLFVVSAGQPPAITLLIGAGGSDFFDFAHASTIGASSPYDAVVGDLNGDGFADVVVSNQTTDTIGVHISSGVGEWEQYCTPKINSLGCTPNLHARGTPSVSNPRPFWVFVSNVLDHKAGMFIYRINGAHASTPFHGGTLCVGPAGIRRTPVKDSSGDPKVTPPNCTGAYAMNFNAFGAGLLGGNPDAGLLVAGNNYQLQVWSRDPGFPPPNDVGLSSALDVTLAP